MRRFRDGRRPPWWSVALTLGILLVVRWVCRHDPPPQVHQAFWFEIGLAIWQGIEWIGGAIAGGASEIWASMQALWGGIRSVGSWVGAIGDAAGGLFRAVGDIFKGLWDTVLSPAFQTLYGWLIKLAQKLQQWFAPILKFLDKVRGAIMRIYRDWLGPIFKAIDVTRRVLDILGTFGVTFAKQLEADLAAVESAIEAPFQYVIGKINELVDWINRIVTIDGLLQRVTLLASLLAYQRDVVNFGINSVIRPLNQTESANYATPIIPATPAEMFGNVRDARAGGGGEIGIAARKMFDGYNELIGRA